MSSKIRQKICNKSIFMLIFEKVLSAFKFWRIFFEKNMAKVEAPLLSYDARGNIKKTIVFSYARTNNIVKYYKKSANPRTHAQTLQRGIYSEAKDAWNLLSEQEKQEYNAKAKGRFLTGYNKYLSEYILEKQFPDEFLFAYLIGIFYGLPVLLFDAVFMPEFLFSKLFEEI